MGYSVRADYLSNSFDRHFGLSCESMSLGPYVGDFFDSIQLLTHSNCNFRSFGSCIPIQEGVGGSSHMLPFTNWLPST